MLISYNGVGVTSVPVHHTELGRTSVSSGRRNITFNTSNNSHHLSTMLWKRVPGALLTLALPSDLFRVREAFLENKDSEDSLDLR